MALWRLYYHLVWATKNRLPLITTDSEADLHRYLTNRATGLGCITHAINGVDNHIHIVASIPPKLAVADYVRDLKGASAHFMSHEPAHSNAELWLATWVWRVLVRW